MCLLKAFEQIYRDALLYISLTANYIFYFYYLNLRKYASMICINILYACYMFNDLVEYMREVHLNNGLTFAE